MCQVFCSLFFGSTSTIHLVSKPALSRPASQRAYSLSSLQACKPEVLMKAVLSSGSYSSRSAYSFSSFAYSVEEFWVTRILREFFPEARRASTWCSLVCSGAKERRACAFDRGFREYSRAASTYSFEKIDSDDSQVVNVRTDCRQGAAQVLFLRDSRKDSIKRCGRKSRYGQMGTFSLTSMFDASSLSLSFSQSVMRGL